MNKVFIVRGTANAKITIRKAKNQKKTKFSDH